MRRERNVKRTFKKKKLRREKCGEKRGEARRGEKEDTETLH